MKMAQTQIQNKEAAASDYFGHSEATDPMETLISKDIIQSCIKKNNPELNVISYKCKSATNSTENYMSLVYFVQVNVSNNRNEFQLHLVLKVMPLDKTKRKMVIEIQGFVKEEIIYKEILPNYANLQFSVGLDPKDVWQDCPKYYGFLTDQKTSTDYLALEDLQHSGYKMLARTIGLDFQHCALLMKSLAKFHALSYSSYSAEAEALQKSYPELQERMFVPFDHVTPEFKTFVADSLKKNVNRLRANGLNKEASVLQESRFDVDHVLRKMHQLLSSKSCEGGHLSVITHGDCWTNNLLFKYRENDVLNLTGVKLVDFQLSRICSRTIDLHFFLGNCTNDEIFAGNSVQGEEKLLGIYHDEFISFTMKLGARATEEIDKLTFQQLKEEYEEFRYYGIVDSILMLQFVYGNNADKAGEDDSESLLLKRLKNIVNIQIPKLLLKYSAVNK